MGGWVPSDLVRIGPTPPLLPPPPLCPVYSSPVSGTPCLQHQEADGDEHGGERARLAVVSLAGAHQQDKGGEGQPPHVVDHLPVPNLQGEEGGQGVGEE
eukprot:scaffold6193_cov123-Isochrysis_galbana.AAC.2